MGMEEMDSKDQKQKVSQGYKRPAPSAAAGWCQAVIVSARLCYSFIIKVSNRDETSALPTQATCPDIDRRTRAGNEPSRILLGPSPG